MTDPAAAQAITVTIDEDDDSVRVDPTTGTIETDQPDGGIVVQLDAKRPQAESEDDKFYANLVDKLDARDLATIANDLHEAISADDRSRDNHLAIVARGYDLLGIELKEPRSGVGDSAAPVEGMSTVTNPVLLDALLKGWANAQAELLPASGPVKIADSGEETSQDDDLAEALERDVNYWFTYTASEYYPDTSHMLLWGTYFKGSGFKKVYRCPMRRRPVSESVDAKDLIVSDAAKDFRSCSRITHQIEMRPSVMKRMQLIGAYRKVSLTQPTGETNTVDAKIASVQGVAAQKQRPEDQPYTIWESQCELDLPEFAPGKFEAEGIPLPYIVTLDKDSREILAIRRDWREDDDECERKQLYVKYPYVPGPGFYGTGLLSILGNLASALTAVDRESLDAGMFASFPGGLIDKAATRQNSNLFRVAPGEFMGVETGGRKIADVAMGMPYHDVTPGLMAMRDKLLAQAKELGGTADIPAAEGIANVPVGTMLAQIEMATKVMAAAHKGMHQAQSQELELVLDLFRANPEDFWRGNKVAPKDYWDEQKFLDALDTVNLVPVSDPNTPSHIHRVAKALALVQLIAVPAFAPRIDPKEALLRCLHVIREDPVNLVIDPPPQQAAPDPNMIKAQAAIMQANTAQQKAQTDAAEVAQDAQTKAAELATEREIAGMNLQREVVIHAGDAEREAQQAKHDQAMDVAEHGMAQQQHGLAVAKHQHDASMDIAGHALDAHQALNPPQPAQPKGG